MGGLWAILCPFPLTTQTSYLPQACFPTHKQTAPTQMLWDAFKNKTPHPPIKTLNFTKVKG